MLSLGVQLQYQIVRLVTGVVLARMMGPENLGIYSFTMASVQLFQIIPAYGVDGTVVRYSPLYRTEKSWDLLRGLWRAALLASIVYGFLSAGILLGILSFGWLRDAPAFSPSVMGFATLLLLSMPIVTYFGAALRTVNPGVLGQLPQFAVLPWMSLALILVAAYQLDNSVNAELAIAAQGAAAIVTIVVSARWLLRNRPVELNRATPRFQLSRWLSSASSFWLIGALELVNTQADLLMLGTLGTAHDAGIYRVAANGANLLGLSVAAVNLYVGPKIPEMHARGDLARLQRLLLLCARGAFVISLVVAGAFWMWGKLLILHVFGASYLDAFGPLMILSAGQLTIVGSGLSGLLLGMSGHERLVASITGVAAVCNVVLNAVLIPRFGAEGSAVATASSVVLWRCLLFVAVKGKMSLNISIFAKQM